MISFSLLKDRTLMIIIFMSLQFYVLPYQTVHAGYSFTDDQTSIEYKSGSTKIAKNHMVWEGPDKNGNKQIFYHNIDTNHTLQITNVISAKQHSNVGENNKGEVVIVWVDKRNYQKLENKWDVFSYNLTTKKEMKLNTEVGQHTEPSTDGNYVTWEYKTDIYFFDFNGNKATKIGKGQNPQMGQNNVVYETNEGINLFDFSTRQTKLIYDLPNSEKITHFKYNGEKILFLVYDINDIMEYRLMPSIYDKPIPVSETFPKPDAYGYGMAIGDNHVAWEKIVDGTIQIYGHDLNQNRSYQVTNGNKDSYLINFNDDQLIIKNDNDQVVYRNITYISPRSNSGSSAPTPNKETKGMVIGNEGGLFQVDNVSVTYQKGTFDQDVEVSLNKVTNPLNLSNDLLSFIIQPWKLSTSHSLSKPATLLFDLKDAEVLYNEEEKLGIYQYNESQKKWVYIGGEFDKRERTIEININEDGIFAVMLYNKTFEDIKNHWAKESIEVLASKWLIDGVSDTYFKPNNNLTRAQFTKMLVDVKGLPLNEKETASFKDVSKKHWGFKWIETGYQAGIINGYNGSFNPDKPLTREEMISMVVRAIYDDTVIQNSSDASLRAYQDNQQISEWARKYIEFAVAEKLIQGSNGNINPTDSTTRAEGATLIYRLMNKL